MKVAVIGSRGFNDFATLKKHLDQIENIDLIISGGAKGADQLAEKYASENELSVQIFKPDYKSFGRGAPLKRNLQIVENADMIIAFWDGKSSGTKHALDHAGKLNKTCLVVDVC